MKKFEIVKENIEIKYKDRKNLRIGCTQDNMNSDPEVVKSFETSEEAMKELKKYETSINMFSSAIGSMYDVTEYYVQENNYDEDGEPEQLGDILEFTEMKINLEDEDGNVIGTFNNYEDAERAYNKYDGECTISF